MSIGTRIREKRKEKRYTQSELAKIVNVSSQVVSNWERGYTDPNHEDVARLAEALDCSSDYLLGRVNNPRYSTIGNRITKLREEINWSPNELAKQINLSPTDLNKIELGERVVENHELQKIAKALGCTTDYLLGKTPVKNQTEEEFLANNRKLVNDIKKNQSVESLQQSAKAAFLTVKDELDIAKRMEKIKKDLIEGNSDGEGLNFMGEPMSEEAIESLLAALEHAERIATLTNKKFTPKKYRDKE